jgi:hypothetical protein
VPRRVHNKYRSSRVAPWATAQTKQTHNNYLLLMNTQKQTSPFSARPHLKRQFIEAVKMLAPNNAFIAEAAGRVPEEMLPQIPGVAAFEFASTVELLCKSWRLRRPIESSHVYRQRSRGLSGRSKISRDQREQNLNAAAAVRSI